jgi:hypothetical protein
VLLAESVGFDRSTLRRGVTDDLIELRSPIRLLPPELVTTTT